jgi:lipase
MKLNVRRWGSSNSTSVVCIHGVTQHGGVFSPLAEHLVERGYAVDAVDLRGHGESGSEPPWNTDTHVQDLIETLDALEIDRVSLVGHSFGGRVAAALAVSLPERIEKIALLDPGLRVPPARVLRSAEIDRLDWSFATVDGAVAAMRSADSIVAAPQSVIEEFVSNDVRKGPDGRFRLRFCPSAAVVAWSETALPAPPIVDIPTLVVRPKASVLDIDEQEQRYRDAIGDQLTWTTVLNGHNVLWESPAETIDAVHRFLTVTK